MQGVDLISMGITPFDAGLPVLVSMLLGGAVATLLVGPFLKREFRLMAVSVWACSCVPGAVFTVAGVFL